MFQVGNKVLELSNYGVNAAHKKESRNLSLLILGPADAVLTFNNRTLSPRDEQPFINEDNITTSDDDIVNVINVDK